MRPHRGISTGFISSLNPGESQEGPWKVVVIGGSYGGLAATATLVRLIRDSKGDCCPQRRISIIVIDERDGFFHTVGAHTVHTTDRQLGRFWNTFTQFPELRDAGVAFHQAKVEHLDTERKEITFLPTSQQLSEPLTAKSRETYHFAVIATGLRRPWPIVPRANYRKDYMLEAVQGPISNLKTAASSHGTLVVVGGGAVGIESAAEAKFHYPDLRVVLIHSRPMLLSSEPVPTQFKQRALSCLRALGVEVILGERARVVLRGKTTMVVLASGQELAADVVTNTTGRTVPNTDFLPGNVKNQPGYLHVDPHLNLSTNLDNNQSCADIFAVGDVVALSGIRRASSAIVMGKIAAHNIFTSILLRENLRGDVTPAPPLEVFKPDDTQRMALALGGTALLCDGTGVFSGEDYYQQMFGADMGLERMLDFIGLRENMNTTDCGM